MIFSSRQCSLFLLLAAAVPGTLGFQVFGLNTKQGAVSTSFCPSSVQEDGRRRGVKTIMQLNAHHNHHDPPSTHPVHLNVEPSTNMIRREIMTHPHSDPLSTIDFGMPKMKERLSLSRLALRLDQEVYEREWFVTGQVNPKYFHPDFRYEDADVELTSLEDYARDVYRLFDQSCSRAEVVQTVVNPERDQTITCTWRCSGRANLLWGLHIKPFIVTTHWEVDSRTSLIRRQVDEYSLPQWDLLVSGVFPFLNGIVTAPPAPPVPPRRLNMAATVPRSPIQSWAARAGFQKYFSRPDRRYEQPDTGNPLDDFVEFLTVDKNNFFHWKPPMPYDKKKLVIPSHNNLPAIRSPTLWDRMQAFAPDNAELVENLTEATRRTESRRSRRFYYALEEEDQKAEEEQAKEEEGEDATVLHHTVAP